MDAFAKALIVADNVLSNSNYKALRKERYQSFDSGTGQQFSEGVLTLEDLAKYAKTHGEPPLISGRQEMFENIINRYI